MPNFFAGARGLQPNSRIDEEMELFALLGYTPTREIIEGDDFNEKVEIKFKGDVHEFIIPSNYPSVAPSSYKKNNVTQDITQVTQEWLPARDGLYKIINPGEGTSRELMLRMRQQSEASAPASTPASASAPASTHASASASAPTVQPSATGPTYYGFAPTYYKY